MALVGDLLIRILGDSKGGSAALQDVQGDIDKTEKKASTFKSALAGMGKGAGAALGAVALKAGQLALEQEKASSKFAAATGMSTEAVKEFDQAARNLWKNNFGENFADIYDTMGRVKKEFNATAKETEELTKYAIILRDTFDYEVNESIRAAGTLAKNFNMEGKEAFDIITATAQQAGDKADDLLDTFNEYSVQFVEMGYSAEEFAGILVKGLQDGAFNTDKVADAVKEFNIRIKDGSDSTNEAVQALLGMEGADQLFNDLSTGAITGADAMKILSEQLKGIEDPLKREQLGVALFGTQWEDVGDSMVMAFTEGTTALQNFEGSTEQAGDQVYNNLTSKMQGLYRSVMGNVLAFSQKFGPALTTFSSLSMSASTMLPGLISGIKNLTVATEGQTIAQRALNFVMSANPIGLVITAIMALIGVFVLAYNKSEWFRKKVDKVWAAIKESTSKFLTGLVEFFKEHWDLLLTVALGPIGALLAAVIKNWDEIKAKTSACSDAVVNTVRNGWEAAKTKTSEILNGISTFISRTWDNIRNTVAQKVQAVKDTIREIPDFMKNAWKWGLDFMRNLADGIRDGIRRFVKSAVQKAKSVVSNLNPFKRQSPSLVDRVKAGVKVISQEYGKLARLRIGPPSVPVPVPTGAPGETGAGGAGGAGGGMSAGQMIGQLIVQAPTPLSPAEVARQTEITQRRLALEWGLK